jgi:protein-disulfide isomerase
VAVAVAFSFTLYLFYVQAFVARAFCPLCVVSGVLVTTLFVIHVFHFWNGNYPLVSDDRRPVEIGYASAVGFAGIGLLAALMLFVNEVGTRRLDQGDSARQFTAMLGRSLPRFIAEEKLMEMKPALYDREQPALKLTEWISSETPSLGGRDKPVKVVVFLDPNCPGCVREFATVEKLAEMYQSKASFYVFPRVLWDFSLLQTQALELARVEGKYFEMWRAQFSHQQKGGLNLAELDGLFDEVQLDKRDLQKRLAAMRPTVERMRDRAIAAGIKGTPTLFINGVAVDLRSLDEGSLARLIEQAASTSSGREQAATTRATQRTIAISEKPTIVSAVTPTSGPPQLP